MMSSTEWPLVVIACEVMRGRIEAYLPKDTPLTFMSYDYHVRPKSMRAAVQAQLDSLEHPSRVIIGYGSCGNGIIGLKSGAHTLFIPRMDDCIAMMLGSYEKYRHEFASNPGTYYLNKGWLEAGNEPMTEYYDYIERYGEKNADYLMQTLYAHYKRLSFIAFSQEELEAYRPKALAVAEFCRKRWGMEYEERMGSDDFLSGLVALPDNPQRSTRDFLVVSPGETVESSMFQRDVTRISPIYGEPRRKLE